MREMMPKEAHHHHNPTPLAPLATASDFLRVYSCKHRLSRARREPQLAAFTEPFSFSLRPPEPCLAARADWRPSGDVTAVQLGIGVELVAPLVGRPLGLGSQQGGSVEIMTCALDGQRFFMVRQRRASEEFASRRFKSSKALREQKKNRTCGPAWRRQTAWGSMTPKNSKFPADPWARFVDQHPGAIALFPGLNPALRTP